MEKDVREIFSRSGPFHLKSPDWDNPDHRRSIAASLIQGVKVLERDRQKKRDGPQAEAPPWWDFFNFQLIDRLVDIEDNSICGAIYELKSFTHNAPQYVVAFRGTLLKLDTIRCDLKLDAKCIKNRLHNTSRFELAMQAVHNIILKAGGSATDVWLTGYSLGSAIALLAGKEMARNGHRIETYLFSPPFLSEPMERINNDKLKKVIRYTSSFLRAGLAITIKGTCNPDEEFVRLSSWFPHLFVNADDYICCPYIDYFEHRMKMDGIGAGRFERLATQNSMTALLSTAFGKDDREHLHLIPSAIVTTNLENSPNFKRPHGIEQWWDPSFKGQSIRYQFT
ncbi:GDSL esterase/lipase At4g10955-like isoform X2 [Tripterygium wilfordii]|uniref:GDSL esterase/lipase At4g10955-like isoform X2 n=1 Tax=Tripterygium wilfordii TaxID=458696 RepID=UPI0018F82056|nr:GDSL esterase/lipase At4g10955-like isoform X2 [Tripterygium wilfordii]XP_038685971.1 GDSL esterase/lipase At4g10955-like isoform X2 [Tripterygium wilfordii]XP_038685972.1 GDSL esterase/lipase At4g10955-like isoform X2 [Tripterygium wilfordii]XP_038685973.1 GDSL esterase/lipase At4g10955-like isoform X2 [Tripterygium wilfordii]XP_038685975.1 GDSL esterase/lipase At4g10955-like isoform X2 [Tripterygium wilfordii]XP_038685976.1 GDSL esterase/lipase At4g10955-like isoform X2 [Tripterygium wilf